MAALSPAAPTLPVEPVIRCRSSAWTHAVAEFRIPAVSVEQRVRAIGLLVLGIVHRPVQPAVAGLSGELEYPARDGDRNSAHGRLFHERVDHFPGRCACDR